MENPRSKEMQDDLKAGAESLYDDLSVVSSLAANELDRLMANDGPRLEILARLADQISKWIPKIEVAGAARSLADSNTVVAMAHALPRSAENTSEVVQGAK